MLSITTEGFKSLKENVLAGATFAGGAAVVELLGQGAASLSY